MTLAVIYKVAIVLTKSQLRGSQKSKLLTSLLGDPRIVLVIDSVLLLALGIFEYTLLVTNAIAGFREIIGGVKVEGFASVPPTIGFTVIVLGVLYEISQPVQFVNTDLVNWLPISPIEYVLDQLSQHRTSTRPCLAYSLEGSLDRHCISDLKWCGLRQRLWP